jgi:hypothetical protein
MFIKKTDARYLKRVAPVCFFELFFIVYTNYPEFIGSSFFKSALFFDHLNPFLNKKRF